MTSEIRTLLARLELVSHAPINAYGRQTPDSGEDIGGKRPPGTDRERRPRQPKAPRIEGDAQSEKRWDEYEDELAAWKASYHRRTVWYFRRRLDARGSNGLPRELSEGELGQIKRELEETLEAWHRTPPPPAGVQLERFSFLWKCMVADDPRSVADVKQFYDIGRATVFRYRSRYRGVRNAA